MKPNNRSSLIDIMYAELRSGKTVELLASGWSMFPSVWKGANLGLKYVPINELHLGDLVAFKREQRAIMHRIVEIANENGELLVRTQGDSNLEQDEWFGNELYLGKVVTINNKSNHRALKPSRKILYRRNEVLKNVLMKYSLILKKILIMVVTHS